MLGRFDASREAIDRALVLHPGWSVAFNSRGVLARAEGHDSEALSHFQEAAAADPSNLRVHLNLGGLYEKMGETQKAISEYEVFLGAWKGDLTRAEAIRTRIERLKKR